MTSGRRSRGEPSSRCPICGERARRLTREDIMPVWARSLLLESLNDAQKAKAFPRLTARVCLGCNARMNILFEDRASQIIKPMARGEPQDLTPTQQSVISGWCVKTHLLQVVGRPAAASLDTAAHHQHREVLRGYLFKMLLDGKPPDGAVVRVAVSGGSQPSIVQPWLPPGLLSSMPEFVAVATLSSFVWETTIWAAEEVDRFLSMTAGDRRVNVVWPPQLGGNSWPPPRQVALLDVLQLMREWKIPVDTQGFRGVDPDTGDVLFRDNMVRSKAAIKNT